MKTLNSLLSIIAYSENYRKLTSPGQNSIIFKKAFSLILACFVILISVEVHSQPLDANIIKLITECNSGKLKSCSKLMKKLQNEKDLSFIMAIGKLNDKDVLTDIAQNKMYSSNVRRVAIKRVDDPEVLIEIAKTDIDKWVREEAVKKITNQEVLIEIAKTDSFEFVRNNAVEKITDQELLIEIAKTDNNESVRKSAVEKITDQEVLFEIAETDNSKWVRENAVKKLTNQNALVVIAVSNDDQDLRLEAIKNIFDRDALIKVSKTSDAEIEIRKKAIEKLDDQEVLVEMAKTDEEWFIRFSAVTKIKDQTILIDIAKNDKHTTVREIATSRITDQRVLNEIAKSDEHWFIRVAATENITDQSTLFWIAKNDSHKNVRVAAVKNITDQSILGWLAKNASYNNVRIKAYNKVTDLIVFADIVKESEGSPFVITGMVDKSCPSWLSVKTDIEWIEGRVKGYVEVHKSIPCLWCEGAQHTWIGRNENVKGGLISVIESDMDDPLKFKVYKDKGYIYMDGKGTLIIPEKKILPDSADILYKGTTNWQGIRVTISFATNAHVTQISSFKMIFQDDKERQAKLFIREGDINLEPNLKQRTTIISTEKKGIVSHEFTETFVFLKDSPFKYDRGGTLSGKYDRLADEFNGHFTAPFQIYFGDNVLTVDGAWSAHRIKQ